MTDPNKPTTKAIATRKIGKRTYRLYANTELWAGNTNAYFCGYVSDPENLDYAIDAHEEEMACMMADLRAEFGF